jgi:hypothetical protein
MAGEIESEKRGGKKIWIIEVEGMSRIGADTREQVFKFLNLFKNAGSAARWN